MTDTGQSGNPTSVSIYTSMGDCKFTDFNLILMMTDDGAAETSAEDENWAENAGIISPGRYRVAKSPDDATSSSQIANGNLPCNAARYSQAQAQLSQFQEQQASAIGKEFIGGALPPFNVGDLVGGTTAGATLASSGIRLGTTALARAGIVASEVGALEFWLLRSVADNTDLGTENQLQTNAFLSHGSNMYNPYDDSSGNTSCQ
jgi:hypothetical protein